MMEGIKSKKIYIILFLFLLVNLFSMSRVEAVQAPLITRPGITLVDPKKPELTPAIPGDYSTILRPSSRLTYSTQGTSSDSTANAYFKNGVQDDGQEHWIKYGKIAIYHGGNIDLKISVLSTSSTLRFYKKDNSNFLRVDMSGKTKGSAKLKYEFLKSDTNEPVDYSGMWNYKRINNLKSITIGSDINFLKGIYTLNDSELLYEDSNNEGPKVEIVGKSGGEKDTQEFTSLFDTTDGFFDQTISIQSGSAAYIKYEKESMAKLELPTPQIMGKVNEEYPNVGYTIVQDMPVQAKTEYYPSNYNMFIDIDKFVDLDSLKTTIYDVDDKQITGNQFLVTKDVSGHRLVISVSGKDLSSKSFIDNSYRIEVDGQLNDKNITTSKYYSEGYFNVPASVSYITDKYSSKVNSENAKTKAILLATGKEQVVGQGTNSSDWKDKKISDLFTEAKAVLPNETLEIVSVENKTFNTKGKSTVSVTIRGSQSGITGTFSIPVNVLAVRKANLYFVDTNGKKIADNIVKTGFETQKYDYSKENKDISNYTFVEIDKSKSDSVSGTYPSDDKDINIYYVYKINQQPVTIKFMDIKIKNRSLFKSKTETVNVGASFTAESVSIPGFTLVGATLDGQAVTLNDNKQVNFIVPEIGAEVIFNYQPEQLKVTTEVDKTSATQSDSLIVTSKIASLIKYEPDQVIENYNNDFLITIRTDQANENANNITDIKLETESKEDVTGTISTYADYVTVALSKAVRNTENLNLVFKTKVKDDAKTGGNIQYEVEVKYSYLLKTDKENDLYEVNLVSPKTMTEIMGSLVISKRPAMIDFGEINYTALSQRIDNPTVDGNLEVLDTREGNKNWELLASIETPLKDGDRVLPSEISYQTSTDDLALGTDAQTVYKNTQQQDRVIVSDEWTANGQGIKLNIKSSDKLKKGTYTGKIRWNLQEGK